MIHAEPRWLVLYCRPRFEFKVEAALIASGIESYLPVRTEMRQWSDRKKRVTAPVFPGYLFVHITERERVAVLEKPGAMKYVSFGGQPAVLNDETIRNIRIATEQPQTFTVERERLALGQPVEVIQGPFAGMTGRLYEMRGSSRVAVQIEAIAQTLLVEVPLSLLKHL